MTENPQYVDDNTALGDVAKFLTGSIRASRRGSGPESRTRQSSSQCSRPSNRARRPMRFKLVSNFFVTVSADAVRHRRRYIREDGSNPFRAWFDSLDPQAAAKVATAVVRLEIRQYVDGRRSLQARVPPMDSVDDPLRHCCFDRQQPARGSILRVARGSIPDVV